MFPRISKFFPELDLDSKISLAIIISFASSIVSFLAVLDKAGTFGGMLGALIVLILGRTAFVVPFGFFWLAMILIKMQKNVELGKSVNPRLGWGIFFLIASLAAFFSLGFGVEKMSEMETGGGLLGYVVYPWALGRFGPLAGGILIFSLGLFGFFLTSQLTFVKFVENVQEIFKDPSKFWNLVPDVFEIWRDHFNAQKPKEDPKSLEDMKTEKGEKKSTKAAILDAKLSDQSNLENSLKKGKLPEAQSALDPKIHSQQKWLLPTFDILKKNHSHSEAGDVEGNKQIIQKTLKSFNIEVEMGEVVTGPTVSQYTLKPASGVKLSAIDSLQRDMALALAAVSLRLEAPIPGKNLVGVEIPNKVKSQVRLRDILQDKSFYDFKGDLPVVVGSDVGGTPVVYSLAKMPHLLVAGATGAGKSVWINSMLLSLLYSYTPEELQLILVDMKRVELKLYEHIPHLLAPVITDSEKAINALKWAVMEMDRRYKLLEEFGKRNIADYNQFARNSNLDELVDLPYLVFVIDELGDLMMLAKNEVEPIIVRLTQMSRAVGIHLVLGTQRPDTHVVTGLIKANVPSRIAFTVASQIDSRVILDQGGAEKLLGQGDGLFMSPSTLQPIRFQGCFVEEIEVRKCANFWGEQAQKYNLQNNRKAEVTEPIKIKIVVPGMQNGSIGGLDDNEDLYEKIKTYITIQQAASTSMLQTAFGIGYPKARKIIEQLEQEGLVGPPNGSKPREVYVSPD